MKSFKEIYIDEAIDIEKLTASLNKRVEKVGWQAQDLSWKRIKLEDELEKIQKKMRKHSIHLDALNANDDVSTWMMNSMA